MNFEKIFSWNESTTIVVNTCYFLFDLMIVLYLKSRVLLLPFYSTSNFNRKNGQNCKNHYEIFEGSTRSTCDVLELRRFRLIPLRVVPVLCTSKGTIWSGVYGNPDQDQEKQFEKNKGFVKIFILIRIRISWFLFRKSGILQRKSWIYV